MKRRRAFTMIELLAVLGIIAILVAFLLPSIHLARERARRIQCINNLKQIGIGLMSYTATYETLPPGAISPSEANDPVANGDALSWTLHLLPFLEQSAIGSMVNDEVGPDDPTNATVRITHLATFMCPAMFPRSDKPVGSAPGVSSYAGCHHDIEGPIAADNRGVLFLNSRIRAADVGDGLSQTFFVGEMPMPSEEGWLSGTRATLRNTGHPLGEVDPTTPGLVALPDKHPLKGPLTLLDLERMIEEGTALAPGAFVGGFGSRHPGEGANFVFGDASVRFLRSRINPEIYRRLGNRDDGEVIDDETAY